MFLFYHTHYHPSRSHSEVFTRLPHFYSTFTDNSQKAYTDLFSLIPISVTMEPTHKDDSHTTDASANGSPDSINPSDEWPRDTVIYFLPTLEGSCEIASNKDLSNVDPFKIPQKTLSMIHQFEIGCQQTRDKYKPPEDSFLADHPAAKESHDKRHTAFIRARAFEKLGPAILASNVGMAGEVKHNGVIRQDLYSKMLKPSTFSDRPARALSIREGGTWTDKGRSMETAYNKYLVSELKVEGRSEGVIVEEPPSEALSREDGTAEPPLESVPAVACDVARPLPKESPSIVAQPFTSPPLIYDSFPGPSSQSHIPSQDQGSAASPRRARPTPSAWTAVPSLNTIPASTSRITLPVWCHDCKNPQFNSESHSALQNPHVQDTLSLSLWYCQSKKASQDPSFARQAMSSVSRLRTLYFLGSSWS